MNSPQYTVTTTLTTICKFNERVGSNCIVCFTKNIPRYHRVAICSCTLGRKIAKGADDTLICFLSRLSVFVCVSVCSPTNSHCFKEYGAHTGPTPLEPRLEEHEYTRATSARWFRRKSFRGHRASRPRVRMKPKIFAGSPLSTRRLSCSCKNDR